MINSVEFSFAIENISKSRLNKNQKRFDSPHEQQETEANSDFECLR